MVTWGSRVGHLSAAAVILAVLSGCSLLPGSPSDDYRSGTDQPWGSGETASTQCHPRPAGQVLTFAAIGLPNPTARALTLDRVTLIEPVGLRMGSFGVYELGKDGADFVSPNVQSGFPPTGDEGFVRAVGETYRAGPGVAVPPGADGEPPFFSLAIELELAGPSRAGFEAVELRYHDADGQKYRARYRQRLEILADGVKSCSDDS